MFSYSMQENPVSQYYDCILPLNAICYYLSDHSKKLNIDCINFVMHK